MRRRLLIVEDSDLNRDLLVQLLEDAYELELALDGESAIELASTAPVELILMDIDLPGMSGLDAVRVLRSQARTATVPIIAVSAHVMPGERELAVDAGCDEFVPKPVDDLHLVETIARLLEPT